MSRRPLWADPVRRAGDVRRRLWSESPIPRQATRRVRAVGVAGDPCAGTGWTRISSGPTSAAFTGSDGYGVALSVSLAYDVTASVTVTPEVRVYRGGAWSDWEPVYYPDTITGPDLAGSRTAWFGGGASPVTGIEVRWDVADAFTALCVTTADNT